MSDYQIERNGNKMDRHKYPAVAGGLVDPTTFQHKKVKATMQNNKKLTARKNK